MKKIFFFISFFIFQNSLYHIVQIKRFVHELVNDAISKLADKNLNNDQKAILEKLALENVDINALSLYTLGELRKSSKKDDIKIIKNLLKIFLKKPY